MVWVATAYLSAICAIVIIHGLMVRGRFFGFPFLAAAMFLTFVLPQIPGLAGDRFLAGDMLARAIFFSFLCLAMCVVGWNIGLKSRVDWDFGFSERRLLQTAAALSIVGAYFFYKFGQLSDEERLRGFLTGAAVAYLFFAKLLTYGLAIALLCFALRPSRAALAIVAFDALFYFERIVIAGRRGETAELGLMIALAFWFQRRWAPPRSVVVAGMLVALAGLLGAGEYRAATYYGGEPDWSAVARIDLAANWRRLLEEGGPEVRNLAVMMDHIARDQIFDYGATHWNSLVHSFVPAQIFGETLKNALYIDVVVSQPRGYDRAAGSTATGMMDAFASFWYFGSLKFLLIAAALAFIYKGAMNGNTGLQLLYMLSAMPSMLVVTHFTNEIVIAWVHTLAFIVPCLAYARIRAVDKRLPPAPAAHSRAAPGPAVLLPGSAV